jgi:hypothetical protein
VFQLGMADYQAAIDMWLHHRLLSFTSVQAVVVLDSMWQIMYKDISMAAIYLDENNWSSTMRLRPQFTAVLQGALVLKAQATTGSVDLTIIRDDLISKFHKMSYKQFPRGCSSIPAILTCNEKVQLFSLSYFRKVYRMNLVKQYNVDILSGRVEFISDLFRILLWTISQVDPVEGFHIPPGVQLKTRNGHHITLTAAGLLKEHCPSEERGEMSMEFIERVYSLQLGNVEHGTVKGGTCTITRVGARLEDALRAGWLNRADVHAQVALGVEQLHANGIAHCDICVDNLFVDSAEDGGRVFLGDLEYCCSKDSKPPTGLRRSDPRAETAEALDHIQLFNLRDELARTWRGEMDR